MTGLTGRIAGRILSPIVDASVLFSFDRTGYRIHRTAFRPEDLAVDLSGKVCLVTGANAGLGRATVLALARLGADVWLLCRNAERGRAALAEVQGVARRGNAHLEQVDVASLSSVRAFVTRLPVPRVDVLVNNAGVLPATRQETADGIELTFATNVLGPFLLTALLLPRLEAAPQGRIINVSSGGMYAERLDLRDIDWKKRAFDGVRAYAQTKRAEVVLTETWAARLAETRVTSNAMHPGWANTPGVETQIPTFHRVMRRLLRSPEEGADTIVWLAACERIADETGKFWFDRAPRRTHYLPWTGESEMDRRRLWNLCRRLAGLSPRELPGLRRRKAPARKFRTARRA